ncbi:transglycosylase SLT domain-containing protein [Meiothermus cerbereus]|uniref:transglycosylase SLT domain-containing protein n=1 Tax=Meiothermus cerbereus TaxID=65552 RepID=UPI003EEDF5D5
MSDLLIAGLAAATAAAVVSEPGQRVVRASVGAVKETLRPTLLLLPSGLEPYRKQLIAAAQGNGIKPSLLAALSLQENRRSDPSITLDNRPEGWITNNRSFDEARKRGWTDAQLARVYGLTQIKGATAITVGYKGTPEGLLNPRTNLELGARYLARQIRQEKSVRMGLVRYNGGNLAVAAVRRGENHFSAKYADMVLARQRLLEAGLAREALANDPRRYV